MPQGNSRNTRRPGRVRKASRSPQLQIIRPAVPNTSAKNGSGTAANSASGGSQKRSRRRLNVSTPTWLTVLLTLFFGMVVIGGVVFAIIAKDFMVMVLVLLVVFATYLFVIKHFYPSENSSSSPLFTFILEVLKIFKGIH